MIVCSDCSSEVIENPYCELSQCTGCGITEGDTYDSDDGREPTAEDEAKDFERWSRITDRQRERD